MKRKQFKAQQRRLLKLANEWIKPIGLGWWVIKLSYDRTGETFKDAEFNEGGFHSGSVARCYPDWRYSMATIIFNMPEVSHLSNNELEDKFVHELMHVFLHEMRVGTNERKQLPHEERVATTLAKAFIWLKEHHESLQRKQLRKQSNNHDYRKVNKKIKVTTVVGLATDEAGRVDSDSGLQG